MLPAFAVFAVFERGAVVQEGVFIGGGGPEYAEKQ